MTKKLKKKDFLVEVSKPFIVRHERNEKHNEVTVAVLKLAIPLKGIGVPITSNIVEKVRKVGIGFPEAKLSFNFRPDAPAVLFTVKSKTECRGNDTPNQEIGDMVAMAKAQAIAAKITARVMMSIMEELEAIRDRLSMAVGLLTDYEKQEHDFVSSEKYMKVFEKRANKE